MTESKEERLEAIAIVGLACRFPGAPDVDAFWRNLCEGVESIRFYSDEELIAAGVDRALLADPAYVKANAALDGVELFDAAFFGLNAAVAQITDPQQRVFLELAWHALEHAGYDSERFHGDIGVFGGLSINTYLLENLAAHRGLIASHGLMQAAMANRGDHLATLTAYKLNLRGPAFTVQSTCSTALSAVHLACQALLSYQTDMAIAGGVSVRVPTTMGYLFQEGGVASPDGHCRPFDARAAGTVFGSGAGAVVLRRLDDALAAGDTVHAVIRGSAANNDGAEKIGYTAPSSDGQRRAIAMAQAVAGTPPETIGYVECHGTGTALGDPIELEALKRAFGAKGPAGRRCAIGSVKSNIGHLDTAAGVAGLIKATLCLAHAKVPPTLHFERPNPALGLEDSPFFVNRELLDWAAPEGHPRRAGVSSFGVGGTNVHVVLEEAPAPARAPEVGEGWRVLVLSARSPSALEASTDALRAHLAAHPGLAIDDVAHTLDLGRRRMEHRRAVVCRSSREAAEALERLPPDRAFTARHRGGGRPVAFLFPGAGSQRPGMGRALYGSVPLFREQLDACLRALEAELGPVLRPVLLPTSPEGEGRAAAALAQTHIAEPALFAVCYALARSLIAWGLRPGALLGEGVGEYVAACVSGALSLEDAAILVAARSRLLARAPDGAMTVVMAPEAALRPRLYERGLSMAMVGRPSFCVASGPPAAIGALERDLAREGVSCRRLGVDRALQSPEVEGAAGELAHALRRVRLRAPEIPLLSALGGAARPGAVAPDPAHLAAQLWRELRLDEGLARLFDEPDRLAVEVGPDRFLTNLARLHPAKAPQQVVIPSLGADEEGDERRALATSLARLWIQGAQVDVTGYAAASTPRRVPLPQYPFERQRLWLEPSQAGAPEDAPPPRRANPDDWFYVPVWRRTAWPTPAASPERAAEHVTLIFSDRLGLGDLLAEQLERRGDRTRRVAAGDRLQRLDGGRWTIDPARPDHYRQVLQDLAAQGEAPTRVFHLFALDPHRVAGSRLEALPRVLGSGLKSLLGLAQALGAGGPGGPVDLCVVTSPIHEVIGDEAICPEKATLLGPALVIGQEYPQLRCRLFDIAPPVPGSVDEAQLVSRLIAESEGAAGPPVVAYRGRYRWVKAHEPTRLVAGEGRRAPLREGGVYLVTGGLGGLGLTLAGHLARAPRAKLLLLGRRGLPERARWGEAAAGGELATVIERVRELESAGAEVMVVAADVADRARMAVVLAEARARFGPLNGVVHAAGVPAGGVIQLKTDEIVERVLAPKVRGALVLDELLAGEPLDFIAYCSSRTSSMGGFGQADYVAANAFLDAFAQYQSRAGAAAVVSIGWCGWQDVGMLARAASERAATAPPAPRPLAEPQPAHDAAPGPSHPLLERRLPSPPGREIYETRLRVETHWVLSDHRILGTPVIAGTTYLEMVRAALEPRAKGRSIELTAIQFLSPCAVLPGEERVLRLELQESPEGFSFQTRSQVAGEAARVHATGQARLLVGEPGARADLPAIVERCRRERTFTDADARDEDHGPRWQCVRHVRWGEGEILATLELPTEFAADLEVMALHPAMLDKSIGTGRDFILGELPYMPYAYQRVLVRRPLARRIHVHTRSRGHQSNRGETPSFDITLLDESGEPLVDIEGFSLKRVNDVAAVYKSQAVQRPASATTAADGENANVFALLMRQEGISPAEGLAAFARILEGAAAPHVIVSTRDVDASLARGLPHTAPLGAAHEDARVRPALPSRPRPALPTAYASPETPTQRALAEILGEMLAIEQVGIHDNFFDLGGDSLLAIQIVARVRERLGRELQVVQLFEAPTVASLAVLLGAPPVQPEGPPQGDSASRGALRRARAIARRQGPESK